MKLVMTIIVFAAGIIQTTNAASLDSLDLVFQNRADLVADDSTVDPTCKEACETTRNEQMRELNKGYDPKALECTSQICGRSSILCSVCPRSRIARCEACADWPGYLRESKRITKEYDQCVAGCDNVSADESTIDGSIVAE